MMNKKGETIVEVVVSLVIIVVCLTLFTTSAVVAGRVNSNVSKMDKELYENIAEAEARTGTSVAFTLQIKDQDAPIQLDIPITIYNGDMKAFSLKEGGP